MIGTSVFIPINFFSQLKQKELFTNKEYKKLNDEIKEKGEDKQLEVKKQAEEKQEISIDSLPTPCRPLAESLPTLYRLSRWSR